MRPDLRLRNAAIQAVEAIMRACREGTDPAGSVPHSVLGPLISDVLAGRTHDHYTEYTIRKRTGGTRLLHAPSEPLMALQYAVLYNILYDFQASPYAHGFVVGRSPVTAAQVHLDQDVVVRMDLRDFFPSCTLDIVERALRRVFTDDQQAAAPTLARLCTHQGALPQGGPASPALSNLCADALDYQLGGIARTLLAHYTRYSDDLIFSARYECEGPVREGQPAWQCRHIIHKQLHADHRGLCSFCNMAAGQLPRYITWFTKVIESHGFAVNRRKTKVMHRTRVQRVNGLVVNYMNSRRTIHPRVDRHYRRRTRAMLHRALLRAQTGDKDGKPYAAHNHIHGRIAYIHQSSPEQAQPLWDQWRVLQETINTGDTHDSILTDR